MPATKSKEETMTKQDQRPKGAFIFHIENHEGEARDIRVDAHTFDTLPSPLARVLHIHKLHRDVTHGEPFEIKSRRWEEDA